MSEVRDSSFRFKVLKSDLKTLFFIYTGNVNYIMSPSHQMGRVGVVSLEYKLLDILSK
jgi:hypothetical protein